MGIFDFLSDLSKAGQKDELGLGGMRSLLGTRGAAPESKRGDEMMSRTGSDSLPGYFDPNTREYVPWYVDLFDGGGLNKSEGLLSDAQKTTTAVDMLNAKRAPVQRAGQMAPGLGSQFSDMEMANRNRAAQMMPGLGNQLSDMEMANRNRAAQMAPGLGSQLSDMEMANRNRAGYGQMPTPAGPGAPSYTPPSSMQMPTQPQQTVLPQANSPQNNVEYQEFVKFLSDDGGFTRELQNPEWMQKAFNRYMRSRAN